MKHHSRLKVILAILALLGSKSAVKAEDVATAAEKDAQAFQEIISSTTSMEIETKRLKGETIDDATIEEMYSVTNAKIKDSLVKSMIEQFFAGIDSKKDCGPEKCTIVRSFVDEIGETQSMESAQKPDGTFLYGMFCSTYGSEHRQCFVVDRLESIKQQKNAKGEWERILPQ